MSIETQKQIDMLIRRGTAKHDPRVQGLQRRLEAERAALVKAKETAERLRQKGQ